MTITFQQLRSAIPGAQPSQLDPGQVAFNVSDGTMYLGTGADSKIDFSGAPVLPAPPAGKGWIQVLLERSALNDFFLANPTSTGGNPPENEQVLTWNTERGQAEWQDAGTGFAYQTTDAAVSGSIGADTSAKITAAIGNPSYIGQNATCIVVGDPGTTYEGLYIYSGGAWVFAAHYAFNTASQVPAVNPQNLLQTSTQAVLNALKTTDDNLQSQITSNDGDIAALQGDMAQAQTDIAGLEASKLNKASNIPVAGQILSFDGSGQLWVDDSQGDVTSVTGDFPILVDNDDPQNPQVKIAAATTTTLGATILSNAIDSTSEDAASTPAATKVAYDLAAAAVPRATYAAEGDIVVGTGAGTFGPLSVGNEGDVLVVSSGVPTWVADTPGDVTSVTATAPITVDNTDPENPIVGVNLATTATPGVVQVELTGNLTLVDGVIDCPDGSTTVKGAVQLNNTLSSTSTSQALTAAQGYALQQQINTLTLANNVILAGGWDATNGVVDGVTSQGAAAGFVNGDPLPAPAAGNTDYYLVCIVPGSDPSAMENGDWLLSDGTQWLVLGVGARPGSASYTQAGIVQLADAAAVLDGTSDTLAITPQALQDNVIDSVTTVNSSQIASATAVNTAYVAAQAASTAAAAAQSTANAALPKAGGTMTGTVVAQNVNVQNTYSLQFAGGTNGSLNAVTDAVNVTSSTTAASATAVKAANDAAVAAGIVASSAQATADAAIPDATFTAAGELLYGTGAGTYNVLPIGTDGQQLIVSSGALAWGQGLAGFTTADNTALGQNSLDSVTTGVDNTAIGVNTGTAVTSGSRNVFIGDNTGDGVTTGNNNTVVGSGAFTTSGGSNNTVIGQAAGTAMTTGNSNVIIGSNAGDSLATANSLVVVGQGAMAAVATGAGTVAIGSNALQNLTSGTGNVAIGYLAGDSVNTGSQNTIVGHNAGNTMTTATGNTILGFAAGNAITLGGQNVLIGSGAGDAITTGFNNTIIGDISGSTTLQGNVILAAGTTIKFQANNSGAWSPDGTNFGTAGQILTSAGSGASVTWADPPASLIGYTTATNVGLGTNAGDSITSGTNNVVLGLDAGTALTSGSNNVIIGAGCGDNITTGVANTYVGATAGGNVATNSEGNTAIGFGAGSIGGLGGGYNTVIGHSAGQSVSSGGGNTFIGYQSGSGVTTGIQNTIVGRYGGTATMSNNVVLADGANNIKLQINQNGAIGVGTTPSYGTAGQILTSQGTGAAPTWSAAPASLTGYTNTATPFNTALGGLAGDAITSGTNNTSLGYNAGSGITSGTNNTFVGTNAGDLLTNGNFNVALGSAALGAQTGGDNNTALGANAGDSVTTGQNNTFVGMSAGSTVTTATNITAVGYLAARAGATGTTAVGSRALQTATGVNNTAVGSSAGAAMATGTDNTFIGFQAGDLATGSASTIVGSNAGSALTSGGANILIGANAGDLITTGFNNTIIGDVNGSTTLTGNVIIAAGSTVKFQANNSGAWSPDGVNYGTANQVLQSNGNAAVPTWVTPVWLPLTTQTLTTTTPTTILTLPIASFRGAAINICVSDVTGGNFHNDSWMVVHDDVVADAQLSGGGAHIGTAPYTLSATISGGDLLIQVTSASTDSTKYVGAYETFAI